MLTDSYWLISLLLDISSVFARLLHVRIALLLADFIRSEQFVFCGEHSTTISWSESYPSNQIPPINSSLEVLFNVSKAFDKD